MADERKCRYCGETNQTSLVGMAIVECSSNAMCLTRCAEIIKDLEWDVEKRDEASQAMIELEERLRKEIMELQQLLKTSMSLLPDSDVAKARDVKVVVRKQEIVALREMLHGLTSELEVCLPILSGTPIGQETYQRIADKIDEAQALLATPIKEAPDG